MTADRFLRPVGDRTFEVHDAGVVKGRVWRSGGDAPDAKRWRANAPHGGEWRPWRFYDSPQIAALECIREYDLRVRREEGRS